MARRKYAVKDPQRLNTKFYEAYDESFLWRKALTLLIITEERDAFTKFLVDQDEGPELVDDKFIDTCEPTAHRLHFSDSTCLT